MNKVQTLDRSVMSKRLVFPASFSASCMLAASAMVALAMAHITKSHIGSESSPSTWTPGVSLIQFRRSKLFQRVAGEEGIWVKARTSAVPVEHSNDLPMQEMPLSLAEATKTRFDRMTTPPPAATTLLPVATTPPPVSSTASAVVISGSLSRALSPNERTLEDLFYARDAAKGNTTMTTSTTAKVETTKGSSVLSNVSTTSASVTISTSTTSASDAANTVDTIEDVLGLDS